MEKPIFVFLALVVALVAASAIPVAVNVEGKFGSINHVIDEETAALLEEHRFLRYLGQYENKKFYTEHREMSYSGANSYCRLVYGFDLAAIASTAEADYVYNVTQSATHYWTSGRGQVKWETGNTTVTLPIVGAHSADFYIRYDCRNVSGTSRQLIASSASELAFPLCQIVTVPQ